MNNIRKINLFLCLVFSFIFLFGNIFSVQAATDTHIYIEQELKQFLDSGNANKEVIVCNFSYTTIDIDDGNGEREVILSINDIKGSVENPGWYDFGRGVNGPYIYEFHDIGYEVSKNGLSAKIFMNVWRCGWTCKKFDLMFKFKIK